MNTNVDTELGMNRREAIKRASFALGAAISASTLAGVAHGQNAATASDWKPSHLNRTQAAIAGVLAERILPRTDTPGALDVGVPAFIDTIYGGYMTQSDKADFRKGLNAVNRSARSAHKKRFVDLSDAQQDGIISDLAAAAEGSEGGFYQKLREVTLVGYFTSKEVGMNVLKYDPIPGMYKGCIPKSEVGDAAWAYS